MPAKTVLMGLALGTCLAGAVPTFLGFEPKAQTPNGWVAWQGTHLDAVTAVSLGSRACRFQVAPLGGGLKFQVPSGTKAGPALVAVTYRTGGSPQARTFVADRSLVVLPPGGAPPGADAAPADPLVVEDPPPVPAGALAIRGMAPHSGAPGTTVTLTGTGFAAAERILLGVTPVTEFHRVGDTRIILKVPGGHPVTAEFLVQTPLARCYSPSRFQVAGERHLGPTVTRFEPARALPGEVVTITGSHLEEVVGVIVGGKESPYVEFGHGALFAVIGPFASGTSPIVLLHRPARGGAELQVASAAPFEVIPPAPVVTHLDPTEGPAGTPVVITGHNLQHTEAITFAQTPAASFTQVSATELWAVAPAGAAQGPLTVRTRHGETSATPEFTPAGPPGPAVLRLERMYLTQAVQRPDGTVPLVARRDGLLRIFLQADRANALQARVRVWLKPAAGEEQIREVGLEGPGVPTVLDEGRLTATCNVFIDGEQMLPGLAVRVELLPMAGASLAPDQDRLPRGGSYQTLDLHSVRPLAVSFLPLRQRTLTGDLVGNLTQANLPTYVAALLTLLPVSAIDADLLPELVTSESLMDSRSCARVLRALERRRLADLPASRHRIYIAIFREPKGCQVSGIAFNNGPACHGLACLVHDASESHRNQTFQDTLVHELGHVLGRRHAPGSTPLSAATELDPAYPFADGRTGVVGLDLPKGLLMDPLRTFDIMGYDVPNWVSDYTYEGIFHALTAPEALPAAP